MYDNEYFVVDMASCSTTGEIINSLSLALETMNRSGKKIVLKLNDIYLNQSQLLSLQSLITSWGCTLDTVETINRDTRAIAENMNIFVQHPLEFSQDSSQHSMSSDFKPFNMATKPSDIASGINSLHFEANLEAIQKELDEKPAIITRPKIEPEITPTPPIFEEEPPLEFKNVEKNSIGVYKKAYDENEILCDNWEEVDFYETPVDDPVISDTKKTTYINHTLRSGQILESDGNVVVIGDCHPGSEIRAKGDITVWGVLSGVAHAGFSSNINARVRALKLNAVQLRIGSCYSRRPDGTNIPYIIKSSIFTPEEARVVDGEIMLFKINQN